VDLVTFRSIALLHEMTSDVKRDISFEVQTNPFFSSELLVSGRRRLLGQASSAEFGVVQPTLRWMAVFTDSSGNQQGLAYENQMLIYAPGACAAGEFQNSVADCYPCPQGCDCQSNGKCQTQPGYWSASERSSPIQCSNADACPGYQSGGASSACLDGYTGRACATCAENYYLLASRCYSCGSSTDQSGQMGGIISAAGLVMLILSIGVATLTAVHLVYLVTAFIILQQVSAIGAQGAASLPGSAGPALATFFQYVSVVNFDLQILRPGCSVPSFTFITLFLGTLGLISFTGLLFVLACLFRLCIVRLRLGGARKLSEEERYLATEKALNSAKIDPATASQQNDLFVISPREDFRRRLTHSLIILCTIFFLKLCTLQMKLLKCVYAPPPTDALYATDDSVKYLYLEADFQTRCYQGDHLWMLLLSLLLFVVYTLGFPWYTFVLLTRSFADDDSTGVIGWLRRRLPMLRAQVSPVERRRRAFLKMNAEEVRVAMEAAHARQPIKAAFKLESASDEAILNGTDKSTLIRLESSTGGARLGGVGGGGSLSPGPVTSAADMVTTSQLLTPAMQKKLATLYIENEHVAYFGYLFLDIRNETFAYRLSALLINFLLACITNFVVSTYQQLFLLGLVFALEALMVNSGRERERD
jgi:hypothetical protein